MHTIGRRSEHGRQHTHVRPRAAIHVPSARAGALEASSMHVTAGYERVVRRCIGAALCAYRFFFFPSPLSLSPMGPPFFLHSSPSFFHSCPVPTLTLPSSLPLLSSSSPPPPHASSYCTPPPPSPCVLYHHLLLFYFTSSTSCSCSFFAASSALSTDITRITTSSSSFSSPFPSHNPPARPPCLPPPPPPPPPVSCQGQTKEDVHPVFAWLLAQS